MDILPGNWEQKNEYFRFEPANIVYSFRIDKFFTRKITGSTQREQSGTFRAHYISDDHKIIEVILTGDQGDVLDSFTLEMVSVNEFKLYRISTGPGPSAQSILLRAK